MHPTMRLYEDVLSSAENVEVRLPPLLSQKRTWTKVNSFWKY